jgi:hypothetical protein
MSHCNICIIPSRQKQSSNAKPNQLVLYKRLPIGQPGGAIPIIYFPKYHRRVVSVKGKLAPKINSERVIKTTMTGITEEVNGHTTIFLPLLDRYIKLPCTNLL